MRSARTAFGVGIAHALGEAEAGWSQVEGELVVVEPGWAVQFLMYPGTERLPQGRGAPQERGATASDRSLHKDVEPLVPADSEL